MAFFLLSLNIKYTFPLFNLDFSFAKYYGREKMRELYRKSRAKTMKYYKENRAGYRLEDRALADASWVISRLGGLNSGTRSWKEMEPRAFTIATIIFAVSFLVGALIWLKGYFKSRKSQLGGKA
ncbi:hypothetical protein AMJ44_00500 [candidate division WOR-1 bacterium DG_54_3]|uniref:Uncharacterized protein n=1 Tax=candidate division WOR-1 bacterium DG_54_3 TaxID=1703775 RepID=A0A0S7Y6S2_UNCSA|nr:MAG: hypothetical protein AMJ44_00500 [candidate division WOR-1 bacterium DG_54_3]